MTKSNFATEQSSRNHSRVPREMRRCTNGNFRCASRSRQQIVMILTSTRRTQDVHAAYKKAKAKQDELWSQLKDREKDIQELQVRYEEKSREKRSLEDFTARRGSLSEGTRTFGARPVQAVPRTGAQIDTRIQTEKEPWQPRPIPTTVNGEFRDRRSSERFYDDVRSRRTSLNRSLDSALTPPTTTQGLRDRRPLSPYTRHPIQTASGERTRLFSQRRIF